MFIPSWFNQSRHITLYLLVIFLLFSFVPKVTEANEVVHPFAPAHQLADSWSCASGPNIDLFVNSVLMIATSSG